MVQLQNQMKEISEKQTNAIKQIIQSRDFNLAEYKKLKKILDSRVITRRDAAVFLERCYADVHFERYFNGHHHKAYAACCFCKGRDNLIKIENLKTDERNWCCQTCRNNITDPDIVDLPTARGSKAELLDDRFTRAQPVESYSAGCETEQMTETQQIGEAQQMADYFVGLEIRK